MTPNPRTRCHPLQQALERTRDRDAAANAVPVAVDSALCQMPRARVATAPVATMGTSSELPGPADARADSWVAQQAQEEINALQLPGWLRRVDIDVRTTKRSRARKTTKRQWGNLQNSKIIQAKIWVKLQTNNG